MSRSRLEMAELQSDEPTMAGEPEVIRREGDFWTVTFRGVTLRIRDSKGMHYLAHLLHHPDRAFDVRELAANLDASRPLVGSRPSPASFDRESLRSAVSKRLRAAIAHFATHHPALARHLTTTVRTGYACAYLTDPDRPVCWRE